jgi:hypothetical protein
MQCPTFALKKNPPPDPKKMHHPNQKVHHPTQKCTTAAEKCTTRDYLVDYTHASGKAAKRQTLPQHSRVRSMCRSAQILLIAAPSTNIHARRHIVTCAED